LEIWLWGNLILHSQLFSGLGGRVPRTLFIRAETDHNQSAGSSGYLLHAKGKHTQTLVLGEEL